MLRRLTVENYALIDKLDIELDSHLNIITGETGAGKSILLGALGLLLGNKNESGSLRDESRNCVIEGIFDLKGYSLESLFEEYDLDYEEQTVIRRMISPSGKSRAFVNDMPVQLSQLKELSSHLIDIHSQHQNQVLADEVFRLRSVDALAGAKFEVEEYAAIYSQLKAAEREVERMEAEAESLRKDEEWLKYQVEEFDAAALRHGEMAELEQELSILENAEQIGQALVEVRNILDAEQIGVLERLSAAHNSISHISRNYPAGEEIASRLYSVIQELKDLGATVADDSERIEADPERLQRLTERVNMIYSLCHKHRVADLDQLIELGEQLRAKLATIAHSDEALQCQREIIATLEQKARRKAAMLHTMREKVARQMSKSIAQTLASLGMPEAKFEVEIVDVVNLMPSGCDKVRFMFSANKNMSVQPIEKIASGGEISRVMLALKAMLAEREQLPTIIFDEIDTGVSGRIADAMGEIIRSLSVNMQVVAITHLPQVASKGESHFVVYKRNSTTNINRLQVDGRIEEIAKMLSGSVITEAALSQARLLLGRGDSLF